MLLKYCSGEQVRKGDRVLFHREHAKIEFVVDELVDDPVADCYLEPGPGVMIAEPKVFGRVYVCDTENTEDLVFQARGQDR